MKNLAADLGHFASTQPDAVLFVFLDSRGRIAESYTYRGFDERTNFLAAALLEDGRVAAGDRVLLVYPPGLEFIAAFFACVKLGAIPVPVPPPDAAGLAGGLERLSHVAADCGALVALTNSWRRPHAATTTQRTTHPAHRHRMSGSGRQSMTSQLLVQPA